MLSLSTLRLLACLVVMQGMLVAAGFAWVRWGVSDAPYGTITKSVFVRIRGQKDYEDLTDPRIPNPFDQMHHEFAELRSR